MMGWAAHLPCFQAAKKLRLTGAVMEDDDAHANANAPDAVDLAEMLKFGAARVIAGGGAGGDASAASGGLGGDALHQYDDARFDALLGKTCPDGKWMEPEHVPTQTSTHVGGGSSSRVAGSGAPLGNGAASAGVTRTAATAAASDGGVAETKPHPHPHAQPKIQSQRQSQSKSQGQGQSKSQGQGQSQSQSQSTNDTDSQEDSQQTPGFDLYHSSICDFVADEEEILASWEGFTADEKRPFEAEAAEVAAAAASATAKAKSKLAGARASPYSGGGGRGGAAGGGSGVDGDGDCTDDDNHDDDDDDDDDDGTRRLDMHVYKGTDYTVARKRADQQAIEELLSQRAKDAAKHATAPKGKRLRSGASKPRSAADGGGSPGYADYDSDLGDDALEAEQRLRKKQRAEKRQATKLKRWAEIGYVSCNLPLPDAGATVGAEADVVGQAGAGAGSMAGWLQQGGVQAAASSSYGIDHVVGDATQPPASALGSKPAVILHAVDTSGEWIDRGMFAAIGRITPQVQATYVLRVAFTPIRIVPRGAHTVYTHTHTQPQPPAASR